MGCASASRSSCLDVVPEATRLWKPEMAPQAIVMNSAGNKKPDAAALFSPFATKKSVKAGMSRLAALPMRLAPAMPTMASAIMPYSR